MDTDLFIEDQKDFEALRQEELTSLGIHEAIRVGIPLAELPEFVLFYMLGA